MFLAKSCFFVPTLALLAPNWNCHTVGNHVVGTFFIIPFVPSRICSCVFHYLNQLFTHSHHLSFLRRNRNRHRIGSLTLFGSRVYRECKNLGVTDNTCTPCTAPQERHTHLTVLMLSNTSCKVLQNLDLPSKNHTHYKTAFPSPFTLSSSNSNRAEIISGLACLKYLHVFLFPAFFPP